MQNVSKRLWRALSGRTQLEVIDSSDPETTKMISRSLSRRLERLETSIMPTTTTSDPVVIELKFVSPEKVVTGSMSLKVDLPATQSPKRQGRR
jgi:hypothetical protein